MGRIKHISVGTNLSRDDWESQNTHSIGGEVTQSIVRSVTYVVAASDAPTHVKAQADYVCDGTADDTEINAAITALVTTASAGDITKGSIILSQGTFYIANPIIVKPYLTLKGQGYDATMLSLANGANCSVIKGYLHPDNGYRMGLNLADFSIEGNKTNQTDTSHGIELTNYRNNLFSHIRIDNCYSSGVYLYGGNTNCFQNVFFWVMSYTSGDDGFYAYAGNNTFFWCFGNNNTRDGFRLDDGDENMFFGCQAESNTGTGFNAITADKNNWFGCMGWANGADGLAYYGATDNKWFGGMLGGNTANGAQVASSGAIVSTRNVIMGTQFSSNDFGIREANGGAGVPTNNNYESNHFYNNATSTITQLSTTNIVRSNQGYVTENSGTATVTAAATTVVVSHGLATTPTRVLVSPTLLSAVTKWWVTTLTSTQFTINVDQVPGAGTATFDWHTQVGEG